MYVPQRVHSSICAGSGCRNRAGRRRPSLQPQLLPGQGTTLLQYAPRIRATELWRQPVLLCWEGVFTVPVSNYYRVSYPPYGIRVNVLPPVYQAVNSGGNPYYYADGSFYRPRERDYEVVEAPLGASVPSLPRDAKDHRDQRRKIL
jgi:hypothetical protein